MCRRSGTFIFLKCRNYLRQHSCLGSVVAVDEYSDNFCYVWTPVKPVSTMLHLSPSVQIDDDSTSLRTDVRKRHAVDTDSAELLQT